MFELEFFSVWFGLGLLTLILEYQRLYNADFRPGFLEWTTLFPRILLAWPTYLLEEFYFWVEEGF